MDTILTTSADGRRGSPAASLPRLAPRLHRPVGARRRESQHLRPLLALSRPLLGDRQQLRLHHPQRRRPRADLQSRPRRRRACLPQHLPASRRDGGAREEGQRAQLPLLLSRLVVQRERPLRLALRRGQLRHRALRRRLRRPGPGAAARELSRLLVRELRQECRVAVGLPGRRQGIYRHRGRPCRGRHGDRGLRPAIHHQRQLEAAGREQHRRLPRLPGALDLLRLPQDHRQPAHGGRRRRLQRQRHARPRQRPCGDRVRLAVGPAGRALGAVVGRGQARAGRAVARRPDQALRRGARHAHRRVQPQHADLPQPGDQRHHGDHHPHLHALGAGQDDGQRLGARRRATRTTSCASSACSTSSNSWGRAASPRPTTRRRWRTASAAIATCARSAGTTSPRACRATARR